LEENKPSTSNNASSIGSTGTKANYRHDDRRRLSYKEKREMEQLEKDIAALEAEKKQIEEALCGGTTSVDEITALSKRLPQLNDELDEKSMRWLELSDIDS
jgi:ATP-binding cassette subfamily F protein uup